MNWVSLIGELTKAGYTQTELAELCDCSQSTISDLSTGYTKDPRSSLADALRALRGDPKKPARKQPKARA